MPNFNFEIVALIIEYILCYSLNEAHLLDIKVQFMQRFQDDLAAKCATKGTGLLNHSVEISFYVRF
jgi:hypothetical protein